MKIFVVTVDREETQIHRVLVDEGKYLTPKKINGRFTDQAQYLVSLMLQDRPSKVIVEEVAFGKALQDSLIKVVEKHGLLLHKDGTVIYM